MISLKKLFGIILFVWALSFAVIYFSFEKWDARGQFGDLFGSVNSLFSGLALAGIIYTIFLQKDELRLQREELALTRQEFQTQNETLKRQRFENTFFQLLTLHNEIVNNLEVTVRNSDDVFIIKSKKAVFKALTQELLAFFTNQIVTRIDDNDILLLKNASESACLSMLDDYPDFHHEYQDQLSHYYRNLYHIFKYVHVSTLISIDEKKMFASIARAQLSQSELLLLIYNCHTENLGYPKFRFLIDEYDILKNIDEKEVFNEHHWTLFNNKKVLIDPFSNQKFAG